MQVKRYSFDGDGHEHAFGGMVGYSDYAALEKQVEALLEVYKAAKRVPLIEQGFYEYHCPICKGKEKSGGKYEIDHAEDCLGSKLAAVRSAGIEMGD